MATVQELFDLTGKAAIVTGAGSGLGIIFSEALAEAGADIACADIDLAHAERTAERIRQLGRRAIAIAADVTDEQAAQAMVARAVAEFGRLDILVNNAGIATVGAAESMAVADWRRTIDVNLTGVFICAQQAAKQMLAAKTGGAIINIASILGAVASEPVQAAAYAAAKGGVVNLTRDLAVQWAQQGVRVNAIGPAYFPSAMTQGIFEDAKLKADIERLTPMGRIGNPDDLKGPVVFLASEAAAYVTGHTLYVDGGWTAW